MSDRLLFWGPTLIWATTWHAILYQLGTSPVAQSVGLRFGIASLMLAAIAYWRGSWQWPSWRLHGWLVLTGAVQYGLNYMSTYHAEKYLPSGLVAVLFALMIFTNALAGVLFFKEVITRRFVAFGMVGVLGIVCIFWRDIAATRADSSAMLGVGLSLVAITMASVGNVMTLKLGKQGLSLVPLLSWTMGYGSILLLGIAALGDGGLVWDARPIYWMSLFYLSAFGSVVAFLLYFRLAQRQGPGRAALMGMIIPVIALAISAVLENWRPDAFALFGIGLSLAGLWGANTSRVAAKG